MVKIRKKDISALSHSALVEIVWSLQKDATWYAKEFGERDYYGDGWDLCVISPRQIRQTIEEYLP